MLSVPSQTRAYSRKEGDACGITIKRQVISVKGHKCGSVPLAFPSLGHLEGNNPLNGMYFLSF